LLEVLQFPTLFSRSALCWPRHFKVVVVSSAPVHSTPHFPIPCSLFALLPVSRVSRPQKQRKGAKKKGGGLQEHRSTSVGSFFLASLLRIRGRGEMGSGSGSLLKVVAKNFDVLAGSVLPYPSPRFVSVFRYPFSSFGR
jgi:hypothetical protein